MITTDDRVPIPDLRILSMDHIHPHEDYDSQRAEPLIAILRDAQYLTNPPIVAPMGQEHDKDQFVVLDGANRYHCFRQLGYEHLLVQVAPYDGGYVELGTWQHVISNWDEVEFVQKLDAISNIQIRRQWNYQSIVQILLQSGTVLAIDSQTQTETLEKRNQILRQIVHLYHQHGTLNRTAIHDPTHIWRLYPNAIALVLFPSYEPQNIMDAAHQQAYLPPGVSRHIIQGRALKVNYPLTRLRDSEISLAAKNNALQDWIQQRIATRGVRYYAESTYQFDE